MSYYERVERDTRLGQFLITLENARIGTPFEIEARPIPRILFNWWDK